MGRGFRRKAIAFLSARGVVLDKSGLKNRTIKMHLAVIFPGARESGQSINKFYLAKMRDELPTSRPQTKQGFYWTDEWRAIRYLALKRSQACCDCCGAHPCPGKPLHVDHIKPRSKFPELELELSNLQVLCMDCNLGKSAKDDTDWRGNVIPFPGSSAA